MIKSSLDRYETRIGRRNLVLSAHLYKNQIRFNCGIIKQLQWNVGTRIYIEYDDEANTLHCIQASKFTDNVAGIYTLNSPCLSQHVNNLYFSDSKLWDYFGLRDIHGTFIVRLDPKDKHACYIMLNLPTILRKRNDRT